jgi:hypothetical protein
VASSAHAFTAGTDRGNPAVQWSGLLVTTAFVFLLAYWFLAPTRQSKAFHAPVNA